MTLPDLLRTLKLLREGVEAQIYKDFDFFGCGCHDSCAHECCLPRLRGFMCNQYETFTSFVSRLQSDI